MSLSAVEAFQFGVNFKDFYKARLNELQIEIKTQKAQLMTYLEIRGSKRLYESKKIKTLGEIQVLNNLLKKLQIDILVYEETKK